MHIVSGWTTLFQTLERGGSPESCSLSQQVKQNCALMKREALSGRLLLSKKHILVNLENVAKHIAVNQDNYTPHIYMCVCCVLHLLIMYTDNDVNEITATKVTVYNRYSISIYSYICHGDVFNIYIYLKVHSPILTMLNLRLTWP